MIHQNLENMSFRNEQNRKNKTNTIRFCETDIPVFLIGNDIPECLREMAPDCINWIELEALEAPSPFSLCSFQYMKN